MGAVFILLAVGALIGAWNMAGTIPTVVYYGVGLLNVTWFYPVTALICGVVGLTIGSSWTTAATLGVAFVALAPLLGANPAITAGAVISGAYFGDKMTPISETTVLVPSVVGGVTTQEHVGAMIWTSGPAILLALLGFVILGVVTPTADVAFDPAQAQAVLAGEFWISPINLLPLIMLIILSLRRAPPFLSIFGSALFAAVLACFTQAPVVAGVRRPAGRRAARDLARRHLHGHRQRVRVEQRERDDRRAVLARRHGLHADHDLAGAGRADLRRDHGGRRVPGAAHPAGPRARPYRRPADRLGRS